MKRGLDEREHCLVVDVRCGDLGKARPQRRQPDETAVPDRGTAGPRTLTGRDASSCWCSREGEVCVTSGFTPKNRRRAPTALVVFIQPGSLGNRIRPRRNECSAGFRVGALRRRVMGRNQVLRVGECGRVRCACGPDVVGSGSRRAVQVRCRPAPWLFGQRPPVITW